MEENKHLVFYINNIELLVYEKSSKAHSFIKLMNNELTAKMNSENLLFAIHDILFCSHSKHSLVQSS